MSQKTVVFCDILFCVFFSVFKGGAGEVENTEKVTEKTAKKHTPKNYMEARLCADNIRTEYG